MNELERFRALLSGATTTTDRDTALAYVAAARSVGKRIAEEMRVARVTLDAHEKRLVGVGHGEQASMLGGT